MMQQPLRTPGAPAQHRGTTLTLLGLLVFGASALISWVTYSNAREEGGTYVVLWGPMLLGVGLLIAGLVALSEAHRAVHAQWYPDPTGGHQRRYWDGTQWTDRVTDGDQETRDELGPPPAGADVDQDATSRPG